MNIEKDIVFYNARQEPFDLYGVYPIDGNGNFTRTPETVAKKINEGVI